MNYPPHHQEQLNKITPLDPFNVKDDPSMPTAKLALNPVEVQKRLERFLLPRLIRANESAYLNSITVTRHKPGRRCVIEYGIRLLQPGHVKQDVTLIGKIRARHSQGDIYRLQEELWQQGFDIDSDDGISIPEPIGRIKDFKMWLQRKIAGDEVWNLLASPNGVQYAYKVAEAAHKIHKTSIATSRTHSMADELRILHERLPVVAKQQDQYSGRIKRILDACNRLGASLDDPEPCGIHRDFYQDQIICSNERFYIIDFDLYCAGDPALDIGNFTAHITEQSLRSLDDAKALLPVEQAMEERFVELAGEKTRQAIRAYATLTLVRLIYISTLFEERRLYTGALLTLCEERLGDMMHLR